MTLRLSAQSLGGTEELLSHQDRCHDPALVLSTGDILGASP